MHDQRSIWWNRPGCEVITITFSCCAHAWRPIQTPNLQKPDLRADSKFRGEAIVFACDCKIESGKIAALLSDVDVTETQSQPPSDLPSRVIISRKSSFCACSPHHRCGLRCLAQACEDKVLSSPQLCSCVFPPPQAFAKIIGNTPKDHVVGSCCYESSAFAT